MMTSLTIDGYRSIKHLELTGLKKINLLVGKNNSGKSSVLEAAGLAARPKFFNPFITTILKTRRTKLIDCKLFFHMLDSENTITFKTIYLNKQEEEITSLTMNYSEVSSSDEIGQNGIINDHLYLTSIDQFLSYVQSFHTGGGDNRSLDRASKKFYPNSKEQLIESNVGFISSSFSPETYDLVSLVIKSRKEKELLDTLRLIDDKIIDISPASQDVYINIGAPERVPISVLGDGITRMTVIVASMIIQEKGILLIDEIDTGFHYSTLKKLWETVLHTLNKQKDLQLFATTHSDECVRALYEVLSEEYPDNINDAPACLIRLERGEEQHYATNYEPDVMIDTLESPNNSDTALVFHEQKYNK